MHKFKQYISFYDCNPDLAIKNNFA